MDFDEIGEGAVTGATTAADGVGEYTTTDQLEEITVYVEEMASAISSHQLSSSTEQTVIVSNNGHIELVPLADADPGQDELAYGMVTMDAEGGKGGEYSLYRLDDANSGILDVAQSSIGVETHEWVNVTTSGEQKQDGDRVQYETYKDNISNPDPTQVVGQIPFEQEQDFGDKLPAELRDGKIFVEIHSGQNSGVHEMEVYSVDAQEIALSSDGKPEMLQLQEMKDIACEVQISADGYVQTGSSDTNSDVTGMVLLGGVENDPLEITNGSGVGGTRRSSRKAGAHRNHSPTAGRSSERLKTRYQNSAHRKHCSCCEHESDSDGKTSTKKRKGYKPKKLHHDASCHKNNSELDLKETVAVTVPINVSAEIKNQSQAPDAHLTPQTKKGKSKKKNKKNVNAPETKTQALQMYSVPENIATGIMSTSQSDGPLIQGGKLGMAGVLPARRGRPPKFTYQIEAAMRAYNKPNSDSDTEGAAPSDVDEAKPGDENDEQNSSNKPHVCNQCGKTFNRPYKLRTHVHSHTRPRKYKCNTCSQKFFYLYDLKRHNTRVHTTAMPWVCTLCGKAFKHQQSLKAHSLRHSDEKNFHCDYCGKDFYELNSLTRHLRSHTGERPYKCSHCNKGFRQPGNLRVHMRSHTGERPFLCDVCGQGFFQRIHMKVHMRVHTGERPHVCDHCGKGFINESSLLDHLRHLRGEKPFGCHICGKMFSSSSRMHSHVRSHTGEKPFRCDTCGKYFRYASSRRRHLQVHQGIKNYKCEFCGKEFSQSGNLRAHTRIHTGERPYRCRVCGKGFTQGTNLKKHIDLHHPGIEALLKMVTSE